MATKKPATVKKNKPTAKKKSAPKTSEAQPAVEASGTQARIIRNMRNCPVHLRLAAYDTEKPFRVELKPRGQYGDVTRIPANLTDTHGFVSGVNTLFEIITQTEAAKIEYPPIGYLDQAAVKVVRTEEQVVSRRPAYDGKGRVPQDRPIGPTIVDLPGSDPRMKALAGEVPDADAMIPEGVDLQRRSVTVEYAKE